MLTIYPDPLKTKSNNNSNQFFEVLSKEINKEIYPFSSARAAMVYSLRAMGLNRMDEILVPPYLSHCVISALSRTSFPSMIPTIKS